MDIYRTSDPAAAYRLSRECMAGHEGEIIVVNVAPCVWTGRLNTMDLSACAGRGLTVAYGEYLGGSIVCMPGDLSVMRVTFGSNEWAPELVDAAAAWLEGRGIAVTRDENDVLADGRKVISWARATGYEGWCQSVVHFSIGPMDLDLVRTVCTKPMTKVPGSLGEYGVTAEDVLGALGIGR